MRDTIAVLLACALLLFLVNAQIRLPARNQDRGQAFDRSLSQSPAPTSESKYLADRECSVDGISLRMERVAVERLLGLPDRGDDSLAYYSQRELWIWYRGSTRIDIVKPLSGDLVEKVRGRRLKLEGRNVPDSDFLLTSLGNPDPDWAHTFRTKNPYVVYHFESFDLAASTRKKKVDWAVLQDVWQDSRRLSKD